MAAVLFLLLLAINVKKTMQKLTLTRLPHCLLCPVVDVKMYQRPQHCYFSSHHGLYRSLDGRSRSSFLKKET